MSTSHDYYRILHLHPDAPDEVIKASYRTLMKQMRVHPDLGGDHATATLINEAFHTLSDPIRRAQYDRSLRNPPPSTHHAPDSAPCAFCGAPCAWTAGGPDDVCGQCGGPLYPSERHQGDTPCRRAIERLPRYMKIAYARSEEPSATTAAVTLDISPHGMRFLTTSELALDERVLIDCGFCSAIAIVRNVRCSPSTYRKGWECGVQFVRLRLKHRAVGPRART